MHVKDRTFVITGGASGLGLATAEDLHQHGGYIAILDMNPENGEKVVKSIGGDRAKFFEVDVTETDSLEAAVKSVVEWTKQTSKPIGGVIPAAGVGRPGKLLDRNLNPIKMEALDWVIDINLRGVLNTIRLVLPHMARNEPIGEDSERGVIVMVSSSSAFEGQVGQLSYAATKGAIRSMTLVLARDLAPNGIRAMSIAPSLFKTAMSDQLSPKVLQALVSATEYPKRLGNAKEFAMMVRQCIENPYLNGECVRLDGAFITYLYKKYESCGYKDFMDLAIIRYSRLTVLCYKNSFKQTASRHPSTFIIIIILNNSTSTLLMYTTTIY